MYAYTEVRRGLPCPMRTLLTLTALTLALTACGSDSDDDESSAAIPTCSDVIKVGETLPDDYEGCQDSEGTITPALVYDCDDGREFWVVGDELVSFKGEPIQEDSEGDLFSECKP